MLARECASSPSEGPACLWSNKEIYEERAQRQERRFTHGEPQPDDTAQ